MINAQLDDQNCKIHKIRSFYLIGALYEQRESNPFEKVVYCPKRVLSCLVKSYRDSLKAEASNDNRDQQR